MNKEELERYLYDAGFRKPTQQEITEANSVNIEKFRAWMLEQKCKGWTFEMCINYAYKAKWTRFGGYLKKELRKEFDEYRTC